MPRRTSAKTLRRKPPLTRLVLEYANDALALHNRMLRLAARIEAVEQVAADATPGHKRGDLKPRPCINCGRLFPPQRVGMWHCDDAPCQEARAIADLSRHYPGDV